MFNAIAARVMNAFPISRLHPTGLIPQRILPFARSAAVGLVVGAASLMSISPGAAQMQDCSAESSLKSVQAGGPVELAFRNASTERRRLYWIDPNGDRKFNGLIEGGNLLRQTTATGHSWVVTDDAEKCLHALTATTEPVTIDVGGVATAQLAPPPPGTQQPIAQTPIAAPPPPAPAAQAPVAAQIPPTLVAAEPQQAAMAQLPQVSPIEQFQLSGAYRVAPRSAAATALNSQASGTVEVSNVKPEWESGQWTFEAVPGSPFVRIRNQWKKTYLTDVNGKLRATAAPANADEAHWSFEPVDGTSFVQFRNRESDRYLIAIAGAPALVADFRQDQENLSHWQIGPAGRAVVAAAPRNSAYDSALANCRELGGYWTGSSCRASDRSRPLTCPRGYEWSEDFGECQWDGGSCPPWQMGRGGVCLSDISCRGGDVRMSRRGYAVCDCPPGSVVWGDYPRLSCVPSIMRIAPLLLGGILGDGPSRQPVGQVFGNKRFCPPGQTGRPPNCVAAAVCPPPLVGTPPQCIRLVPRPTPVNNPVVTSCPAGQTGTPPNCVKPVAPVVTTCPAGQTGTPPNCVPGVTTTTPVCAIGQTNVNGVCTNLNASITCTGGKIEQGVCGCPAGTTLTGGGRNFQCVASTAPKVCPAGTSGPNCAPDAPCDPRTQTGTPGKCVEKVIPCAGGTVDRGSGTCACPTGLRAVDGVCTRMACRDGVMLGDQCRCNNPGWVAQRTSFSTFACVGPATAAQCPSDSTGVAPACTCKAGTSGQPGNCKTTSTIAAPNTNPRQCSAGENPQAANCLCPNSMNIVNNICTASTIIKPNTNPRQCSAGENPQAANCLCPNSMNIVNNICTASTIIKPNTNPRQCSAGENPQAANCLCPNSMNIVNNICTASTIIKPNTNPRQCSAGENPQAANCLCPNTMNIVNGICTAPTIIKPNTNPRQCSAGENPQAANCLCPNTMNIVNGICTAPTIIKPNTNPRQCNAGERPQSANCLCPNSMNIVNGICTAPTIIKPNTNPRQCSAGENPQAANCLCPNTMNIVNGICTAPTVIKPNTNPRNCNAGENPQAANCLCKGPLQIGANGICSPPSNIRLAPAPCPAGTTGTPPNCVKPPPAACPAGTTGTPPNCVKPPPAACPAGTTGTPPNCVRAPPATCPAGTTGTPPNCVRPPPATCPAGTIGKPPNCVRPPPTCPAGMTGTPPNCVRPPPATCPAGTTGKPPNCVRPPPATCPAGTTGTPPNCVRPPPATCPAGTTGTPPNCVRPPPPPPPRPPACSPPKKLNAAGQCL